MKIAIPDNNPGRGEVFPSAFKLKGHNVSVHQEPATFLTSIIQESRPTKPAPFDLMLVDVCLPGLYSRAQVMHSLQSKWSLQNSPPSSVQLLIQLGIITHRFSTGTTFL